METIAYSSATQKDKTLSFAITWNSLCSVKEVSYRQACIASCRSYVEPKEIRLTEAESTVVVSRGWGERW